MTRLGRYVLLGSGIALCLVLVCGAEWNPEEIDCAKTIGVRLDRPTDPAEATYVRHLAWLASVIVVGKVEEIEHDIRGMYPTIVNVNVLSVEKGPVSIDDVVSVDLFAGPVYRPAYDKILDQIVDHEPSFVEGEMVLLFLTTATMKDPDQPGIYSLGPGHYRPLNDVKWSVEGGAAKLVDVPYNVHPMQWMRDEIAVAATTQSNGCQQGGQ